MLQYTTVGYSQCVVQVFRCFVPLLRDQNPKLNLQAQHAFQEMLPVIASFNGLSAIIGLTVQTICVNLRTRNVDLQRSASCVLDTVIEHVGKYYLKLTGNVRNYCVL